ncbi:MAG TPA: nuclear transport factor 2 family protein [Solirubrobacterales bacterium]
MTDTESVNAWLERYVEAWGSYDREQIGELFAEDARYRYHPFDEPIRGREAIVESWFDEPDERGTYEAEYRPVAIDGDTVVAVGSSNYRDSPRDEIARVYDNCFVIRFDDDGRCVDFVEWYMKRPGA